MFGKKKKNKKDEREISVSDYERLGRSLADVIEGGYASHWRIFKINFMRGVFFGLGSLIGGTIVVALIIWTLSLFTEIPVIGDVFETIQDSVKEETQNIE